MKPDGPSAEKSAERCAVSRAIGHSGFAWHCSMKVPTRRRFKEANVRPPSCAVAAPGRGRDSRIDIFLLGMPFSVHAGIAFANSKPSQVNGSRRSMKFRHNEGMEWPLKLPGTRSWRSSPPYQRQVPRLSCVRRCPQDSPPVPHLDIPSLGSCRAPKNVSLVTVPHRRALASDLGPRFGLSRKECDRDHHSNVSRNFPFLFSYPQRIES
jgi:hypothetical protein